MRGRALEWTRLQLHEGGEVSFAETDGSFRLRSNFETLRDFDDTLTREETQEERDFPSRAHQRRRVR